jgi:hypothetical protein
MKSFWKSNKSTKSRSNRQLRSRLNESRPTNQSPPPVTASTYNKEHQPRQDHYKNNNRHAPDFNKQQNQRKKNSIYISRKLGKVIIK